MIVQTQAASSTAPAVTVRPYRQGQLDGLCGVYAIVNMLRLTLPKRGRGDAFWRGIFQEVIELAGKHVGLERAVVNGITRKQLNRILVDLVEHLRQTRNVKLQVERLRLKSRSTSPSKLINRLGERANGGLPLIVELKGGLNHWTVLKQVREDGVTLFDSFGMRDVRRTRFAIGRKADRSTLRVRSAFSLATSSAQD